MALVNRKSTETKKKRLSSLTPPQAFRYINRIIGFDSEAVRQAGQSATSDSVGNYSGTLAFLLKRLMLPG